MLHILTTAFGAGLVAASNTASKSSPQPSFLARYGLIFIIIIGIGAYYLMSRRRATYARQNVRDEVEAGDEVVTTSGFIGIVDRVEGDRVWLEIAPGTVVELMKAAIARRTLPEPPEDEVGEGAGDAAGTLGVPGVAGSDGAGEAGGDGAGEAEEARDDPGAGGRGE